MSQTDSQLKRQEDTIRLMQRDIEQKGKIFTDKKRDFDRLQNSHRQVLRDEENSKNKTEAAEKNLRVFQKTYDAANEVFLKAKATADKERAAIESYTQEIATLDAELKRLNMALGKAEQDLGSYRQAHMRAANDNDSSFRRAA